LYTPATFFLKEISQTLLSISGSSRVARQVRQQPGAGATVGQQPVGCLFGALPVVLATLFFYRFSENQAAATAECLLNPLTQFLWHHNGRSSHP
jgi:TorA maturation chaperone TorD